MKTIRIFGIILTCFLVLGITASDVQARAKAGKSKEKKTEVRQDNIKGTTDAPAAPPEFVVRLSGSDCAALQHCEIQVIVYYSTGAEVGSAQYVYPQTDYSFHLAPGPGISVCATLQVMNCDPGYHITPVPNCIAGPFVPNTSYMIPLKYTCN